MVQKTGVATKTVSAEEYGLRLQRLTRAYLPVKVRDFFVGTVLPFTLFHPALEEGKRDLSLQVLFPEGERYDRSIHDWLTRAGIEEVYIGKDKRDAFLEYLSANVKDILHSRDISPIQKTMLVYDSAENIVSKVFAERPSRTNIALGCELIENIALHIALDDLGTNALLGIFSKDYYTFTHSVQVAMLGMAFCSHLEWSKEEVIDFGIGALFHDVGKSHIDDEILNKPSRLTKEEFEIIKKHSIMGYQKLKDTQTMSPRQLTVPLYHHEAMDGTGYPRGLRGDQIHRYARVARIIDCYDALSTKRCYKDALPTSRVLEIMSVEMGPTFDKRLLRAFVQYLESEGKVEAPGGLGQTGRDNRLYLKPGNEVVLELGEGEVELKATVLGSGAEQGLVLRVPTGVGIAEHLHPGREIAVRYVHADTTYRFRSGILNYVSGPIPRIILTRPSHVDTLVMRKDLRSDCLIRSLVAVRGAQFPGVILNISSGGCRVVLKLREDIPLPGMGVGDEVRMLINPSNGCKRPVILGTVSNLNMSKGKALLGIEFAETGEEAMAAIRRCIDADDNDSRLHS